MPSWFPGAGFKRCARKWCPIVDNAIQSAFDKVKGELVSSPGASRLSLCRLLNVWFTDSAQASGKAAPSVAANMISKLDEHSTELDVFAAKGVPGSMYIAGTDTVSEVLQGEVHVVFQALS
jgi:hypothetical protein